MKNGNYSNDPIIPEIQKLIALYGGDPTTLAGDLTTQMIHNSLKFLSEGYDLGKLKLVTKAFKEIRHAYKIFKKYPEIKCISIFGSARTPSDHPDYLAAEQLGRLMAEQKWMCITGAANGIMNAGMQGAQASSSFGLSIRLPFEDTANELITGDPKLMVFRYFFTRKLMFISHSNAIAAFPGGFGTLDELFEILTLMQTGKSTIIPVILMEGSNGQYWENWKKYLDEHLAANGWIGPHDHNFFFLTNSAEKARDHILQFYRVYHSSRYVNNLFVMRLQKTLNKEQVSELQQRFSKLIASGSMEIRPALPGENEYLDLPRLVFDFTRKDMGLLRSMIDAINLF